MSSKELAQFARESLRNGKTAQQIWAEATAKFGPELVEIYWRVPRENIQAFVRSCAQKLNIQPPIVDVGCGRRSHKLEVTEALGKDVLYVAFDHFIHPDEEADPDRAPNLSADLLAIPLTDNSAGAVICAEVLEHVHNDGSALDEISRILRPGGWLILTLPGKDIPKHEKLPYQIDYQRYTMDDATTLLSSHGFTEIKISERTLWNLQINIFATATKI